MLQNIMVVLNGITSNLGFFCMIGLLICLGISAVSQRGKEIKNTLIFAPITMIAITLASATALTYLERPVSVDTVHDVQYTGDQN